MLKPNPSREDSHAVERGAHSCSEDDRDAHGAGDRVEADPADGQNRYEDDCPENIAGDDVQDFGRFAHYSAFPAFRWANVRIAYRWDGRKSRRWAKSLVAGRVALRTA